MREFFKHDVPIKPADFVLCVNLSSHGAPGYYEQMWAKRIEKFKFRIACIPFMTYGMALGDIVETDEDFNILRVAEKTGRRVLRVVIIPESLNELHERLHGWAIETGLLYEWRSSDYLAIDYPPVGQPIPSLAHLDLLAQQKAIAYELDDGTLKPAT